jgi:hypothetical protein
VTHLRKARLAEIDASEQGQEVDGSSVEVQFNPTTLRAKISNATAGGAQAGDPARQRPGDGKLQVSFDLVFDTADEGTADDGVSVLERTQSVERFVRPRGAQPGDEAPPRVLFEWGSFRVQGTMESATLDIDLWDAEGVPLRAKVAVVINGQDPRWAYRPAGEGAATRAAGTPGGGLLGAARSALAPVAALAAGAAGAASAAARRAGLPGTAGAAGTVRRIVQALPGESLAQLAARSGIAPNAWRALAPGTSGNPLRLSLGQEVAIPAARPGGIADGSRPAGAERALTRAALPLSATASAPAGAAAASGSSTRTPAAPAGAALVAAADPRLAGQALAAAGGARGAIQARAQAAHQATVAERRAAFTRGAGPAAAALPDAGDASDRPWGQGLPLQPRRGPGTSAPPGAIAQPMAQAPRARRAPSRQPGRGCRPR